MARYLATLIAVAFYTEFTSELFELRCAHCPIVFRVCHLLTDRGQYIGLQPKWCLMAVRPTRLEEESEIGHVRLRLDLGLEAA